jgi:hypothetical protein
MGRVKKLLGKKFVLGGIVILVVVVVGAAGYFFYQYQNTQKALKSTGALPETAVGDLINEVGSKYLLPEGEEPTIATVSDIDALSGQEFFSKAKNGDRVLIYTESKLAILYRPTDKKIINIAPVNINEDLEVQEEVAGATTETKGTIAIYNGTNVTGLTADAQKAIESIFPNVEITDRTNASSRGYEKTIIVPINPDQKALATSLSQILGAVVEEEVPQGEDTPDADILIVLGSDFSEVQPTKTPKEE